MIKRISILHWQLIILIALAVIRGLIYLSLFPPWVAPDEPAHFEVVRIIGQEQQLPTSNYYQATSIDIALEIAAEDYNIRTELTDLVWSFITFYMDSRDFNFLEEWCHRARYYQHRHKVV